MDTNIKLHPQTFSILPFMIQAKYKNSNRDERARVIAASSAALVDKIPLLVANTLGLRMEDLQSTLRTRELSEARSIIFYILRIKTQITWKGMADIFNRDHSTAMYGYHTASDLIETDPLFASKIERLMKLIN